MLFQNDLKLSLTRRAFLFRSTTGLGALALGTLLKEDLLGANAAPSAGGAVKSLHFAPRAKRVIYLFMSGAPSQIELFDHKPKLKELTGSELPKSVRGDQRITGMTSGQKQLLVVGSPFDFKQHGKCGAEISDLLPHT